MKILVFEPLKHPCREDVPHTLDRFHEIVGGYIQAIYPWEDRVAVVCDEEGLLKGYELNRCIAPGVVIAGTFFICGVGDEDFTDLPDDLADKYERMFYEPQAFLHTAQGILAVSGSGRMTLVM